MRVYHGSPRKLKILKPSLAKGLTKFENQKAIFFTKTFDHAALYAIGKTLKRKTVFAVIQKKLIIVGNFLPKEGYVYEVEVEKSKLQNGERGQVACKIDIIPNKITKVKPKYYNTKIIHVNSLEELKKTLTK